MERIGNVARQHGISANTPRRIIVDSGAVYFNYGLATERLLGATRGGNSFTIETDVREVEADGAKGPVKGLRRPISIVATINANMLEFTAQNLLAALPGAVAVDIMSTDTTPVKLYDSITRQASIADDDYFENIALVGEVSGSNRPVICILKNALHTGNLEMSTTERDEMVSELVFTGHFDPADLDAEPWEIRYPEIATV